MTSNRLTQKNDVYSLGVVCSFGDNQLITIVI